MKDGTQYPRNTALAVLVGGEPGSGKSNLCLEFPDPYIIDAEKNLRNAIERHPEKKFWFDDPEVDDAGKPIALEASWLRVETLIKANAAKPEVGTLVIDGLGRIADYLKAYLVHVGSQAEKPLTVGGQKVMTMSLWGPFADLMKKLIFLCRAYGKPFVLTTHLKVSENELNAATLEQKVNLQGALVNDFPKLFTDFWCCEAKPDSNERYKKANGVRYFVRTVPTYRIALKQSCGLPAEFEPDSVEFKKLMASLNGAPKP
jgi:hypothetical protein